MTRIRLIGGPWPERIGAVGSIVECDLRIYPFCSRGRNEVIIVLDDDPLDATWPTRDGPMWTCAIDRKHVAPEVR